MSKSDAWFLTIALILILLLMLGVAGAISEWIAPTIQRQIAESWTL